MSVVKLGGMVFPGSAPSGWWFSELTDWLSVPDAKGSWSERSNAHGAFGAGFGWRGRVSPSFRVHFAGADGAEALQALTVLRGLAGHESVPMAVDLGDGERTRLVRVESVDVPDTHGRSVVSAVVYCTAADPLMYGATVSGSTGVPTPGVGIADPIVDPISEGAPGNLGQVTVANDGTAETSVRVTVAGGLDGVEVTCLQSGRVLRLGRLIPKGSSVVFDSRTGRVALDGQSDVTGFLTVDEWSQVPPGLSYTFQFTPIGAVVGSPSMTVELDPAYF